MTNSKPVTKKKVKLSLDIPVAYRLKTLARDKGITRSELANSYLSSCMMNDRAILEQDVRLAMDNFEVSKFRLKRHKINNYELVFNEVEQ